MKKYIKSESGNLVYTIERQEHSATFRTPENYFKHATRNVWYSTTGFNMFVQYKGAFYMIDRIEAHGYITSLEFAAITAEEAAAVKMERTAQAMNEAQEHDAKTSAAALDYDTETAEAEAREARFSADYAAILAKDAAELAAEAGTSDAASAADTASEYAAFARSYADSATETAEQAAAEQAERTAWMNDNPERAAYIEAEATAHNWSAEETASSINYYMCIQTANRAALALLDAYAEMTGKPAYDMDAAAVHRVARDEITGTGARATEYDRETVAAMVEAIADKWTQDHQPEAADTLKTYPTTAEAYSAGARDLVQVIDHETAARAFEAGEQAAQAIPAAHNRRRIEERTRAIDRVVSERQRYADKDAAAQHIAGQPADYLHRHTINLGTSRYPDYRPEYEQYHTDTLILHGTASKSGRSVDRLSISYAVLVID